MTTFRVKRISKQWSSSHSTLSYTVVCWKGSTSCQKGHFFRSFRVFGDFRSKNRSTDKWTTAKTANDIHLDIAQHPWAVVKQFCATIFQGFTAICADPLPSLPRIRALLRIARTAIVLCDDSRRFLFFCDTNDARVVTLFAKSRCDPLSVHTTCMCTHADFTRPQSDEKKSHYDSFSISLLFFSHSPLRSFYSICIHTLRQRGQAVCTHTHARMHEKKEDCCLTRLCFYTHTHTHSDKNRSNMRSKKKKNLRK